MKRTVREIAVAALVALLVATPSLVAGQLRTVPPIDQFPDLVSALQQTPGCLGAETARTSTGKQVIFAWFENKQAVMTWYYSDAHLASMRLVGASPAAHPMAGVPDDGRPVMAIASLTPLASADGAKTAFAVSQIAIELYAPLPGGIAVGGRFAPAVLTVPGLRDLPMAPPQTPR